MPYHSIDVLPDNVKDVLPLHAQHIYKEAFNSAYEEYKSPQNRRDDVDREEVSHRVAWAAVKRRYRKEEDGLWHSIKK
jgi:cation transport regulator